METRAQTMIVKEHDVVVDQLASSGARPSTAIFDRTPPQHLDAEVAVLGAALLSRAALAEVVEILRPDDFYRSAHRSLYETILELFARGEVIDPITVVDKLARTAKLDQIGGASAIHDLVATVPTAANAVYYARIVREKAILRRLIEAGTQVVALGYEGGDDVNLTIDRAEQLVYDVAQGRVSSEFSPLKELLSEGFERIEQRFENRSEVTGLPTGFNDLDRLTAGLQPQNLVIIAARPAVGKCLAGSTRVVDPKTGALIPLERLVAGASPQTDAHTLSLGPTLQLHPTEPAEFLDNGVHQTFVLRTRLGREIRATANHPFLTPAGWRPLAWLEPGDLVAVPRIVDVFGRDGLPDTEVVLLGYLLGTGGSVGRTPSLTTASCRVASDLASCAANFDVFLTVSQPVPAGVRYRLRARPHPMVGTAIAQATGVDPATVLRALGRDAQVSRAAGARVRRAARAVAYAPNRNRLTGMLRQHGVLGCPRHHTFVPDAIFRAPRRQVALFLSRLFATGGSVRVSGCHVRVGFTTASRTLARDVQHLLLRFGLHARIRPRERRDGGHSHELVVDDARHVLDFCRQIGIYSQEAQCAAVIAALAGTAHPAARHQRELVEVPDDATGEHSDVAWDAVVTIQPHGPERVYDLTIPGAENFVADDLIVHNSSLSLGIAQYVTVELRRPAIIFSLEMSKSEIVDRILASESNVNASKIRTGRLDDPDWASLSDAMGRLAEAPLFIDDTPSITLLEIRAKSRRLKQRHGLELVVVDYMQLMQSHRRPENRQQEVSEISRGLKMLAKELDLPVVALSQLSRQPETRTDKRPQLADLRESGCLVADTRILRADTVTWTTLGELYRMKARNLPVWTLDARGRLVRGCMTRVFCSGIKPVYGLRLASGHSVTASANHPFLTVDGWRRLDELSVGECLAVASTVRASAINAVSGPQLHTGRRRSVLAGANDRPRRSITAKMRRPPDLTPVPSPLGRTNLQRHAASVIRAGAIPTEGNRSRCSGRPEPATAGFDQPSTLVRPDIRWEPVVAIQPLDPRPVFDATVLLTHNFVANGIVAHNSIEQDSDVVAFIYRDELYDPDSPQRGTAELIIAKHRNGPTGMVKLAFLDHLTKFANLARTSH